MRRGATSGNWAPKIPPLQPSDIDTGRALRYNARGRAEESGNGDETVDTNEEPLWWTFSTQFVGFSLAVLLIVACGDIVPARVVAVFGWDTKSIEWAAGVLFCSLVALALTCGILMPLRKLLNEKRLCGIAGWVRWVLFIPAAIVLGWFVELVPRFLFNLAEIIINRQITLRSGFDEFMWQCWEPLLVVALVVDLAPRGKSVVLLAGAALKGFFWCRSVWDSFAFVKGWGRYAQSHPWSFPSELTSCPIWWTVLVQLFFLVALAMLVAKTRTASAAKRGSQKAPLTASGGG